MRLHESLWAGLLGSTFDIECTGREDCMGSRLALSQWSGSSRVRELWNTTCCGMYARGWGRGIGMVIRRFALRWIKLVTRLRKEHRSMHLGQ